jgi:hypothetical protein
MKVPPSIKNKMHRVAKLHYEAKKLTISLLPKAMIFICFEVVTEKAWMN